MKSIDQEFTQAVTTWFSENQRDLPWRKGSRSLPYMGVRNHAAADPRRGGAGILSPLDGSAAELCVISRKARKKRCLSFGRGLLL